jgi:two-component sensor histidine kinase
VNRFFRSFSWLTFKRKPRLQTLLAVSFCATAIIIVLTLCLVIKHEADKQMIRIVHRELRQVSEQAADRVTKWMYERSIDAQVLAGVMGRINSETKKQAALDEIKAIYRSSIAWAGMVDKDCRVVRATGNLFLGEVVRDGQCQQALKAPLMTRVHPNPRLQDTPFSDFDPMTFVTLTHPITNEANDTIGFAAVEIRVNYFDALLNAVPIRIAEGHPTQSFIISKNTNEVLIGLNCFGTILTDEFVSNLGEARTDAFVSWPDGSDYITGAFPTKAFRNIPDLNWIVATRATRADALSGVSEMAYWMVVWGALIAGLGLLAGLAVARILGRPLHKLTASSKLDHDRHLIPPEVSYYREIDELNDALTQRFDDLHDAKDRIQVALAERSEALADREALLKEVHHRVKNNLQVIISLMRLQGSRVRSNPSGRMVIERLTSRVQVLGWLYSKLYEKAIFDNIDSRDIILPLLQQIQDTYPSDVVIESEIDSIQLGFDQVLVLGMLAIEITTNAVQHAYDGDEGVVNVLLRRIAGDQYEFVVSDHGQGFDATKKFDGIGLTLSNRMAGQLGGKLVVDSTEDGTVVRVDFTIVLPETSLPGQETVPA